MTALAVRASLAIFLTSGASVVRADTLLLTPIRDNTLIEDNTTYSNGLGPLFIGQIASSSPRRALLKFDLSAIPANAQVTSATLRIFIDRNAIGSGNDTTALHRVLADWGEGTSDVTGGSGTLASAGDATWTHRFFGTPGGSGPTWAAPGGDFVGAASGTLAILSTGSYTFASQPGMVADVQAWVGNPTLNHGWIIVGPEDERSQTARRIRSRETPATADRPTLTIEYTTTTPTTSRQVPLPWWWPLLALPLLSRIATRRP
jgi:hypothetical protein